MIFFLGKRSARLVHKRMEELPTKRMAFAGGKCVASLASNARISFSKGRASFETVTAAARADGVPRNAAARTRASRLIGLQIGILTNFRISEAVVKLIVEFIFILPGV